MLGYELYTNETVDPTRAYVGFDGYVPGAHMQLSYSGQMHEDFVDPVKALHQIFYMFNMQHPADYKAHSLSVGDVVVIIEGGVRTAFACDMVGWKRLDSFDPATKNPAWSTRS